MFIAALLAAALAQPKLGDVDFGPGYVIPMTCTEESGVKKLTPTLQVAVSRPEQSLGLMYRKELDENSGMVFLWEDGRKRVLYMRNTYVPLDAGWFTSTGHLTEVSPLQKLDETWVWSKRDDIHYAVEMNQGWYAKNCGGTVDLDMEALRQAIVAKHADPSVFLPALAAEASVLAASEPAEASAGETTAPRVDAEPVAPNATDTELPDTELPDTALLSRYLRTPQRVVLP
jgi:uncharacterized membrane protein (UPF0127 family)